MNQQKKNKIHLTKKKQKKKSKDTKYWREKDSELM